MARRFILVTIKNPPRIKLSYQIRVLFTSYKDIILSNINFGLRKVILKSEQLRYRGFSNNRETFKVQLLIILCTKIHTENKKSMGELMTLTRTRFH